MRLDNCNLISGYSDLPPFTWLWRVLWPHDIMPTHRHEIGPVFRQEGNERGAGADNAAQRDQRVPPPFHAAYVRRLGRQRSITTYLVLPGLRGRESHPDPPCCRGPAPDKIIALPVQDLRSAGAPAWFSRTVLLNSAAMPACEMARAVILAMRGTCPAGSK
jgi:hypothetical protein